MEVRVYKMATKKSSIMRTSKEFKKLMEDLAIERVKIGKDKKVTPTSRMSLATYRLLMSDPNLVQRLKMSDFK